MLLKEIIRPYRSGNYILKGAELDEKEFIQEPHTQAAAFSDYDNLSYDSFGYMYSHL